ncbi:hypothetical protein [Mycobacterium phage Weirdo19]|uniref:Uncharacterized protein n=1 Tax=Mycobacterium phage Weirdo19 TaxID=2601610 RepID=A0A6M2YSY4_9CAUD|nr:hypothetical protein KDJ11_gp86 [Mycobacterium phage Weirdo19]QEA10854.1 hypothetical protein [Mycobacterium phage Weirdo19]
MSMFDYRVSRELAATDPPFYALIMAAMRKADTQNAARLRAVFPEVWAEFEARYHAVGGVLPTDDPDAALDHQCTCGHDVDDHGDGVVHTGCCALTPAGMCECDAYLTASVRR